MNTKARLIQSVDRQMIETEIEIENLIPAMEIRGYVFSGLNESPYVREELRGQPKFENVCGPMWDGDAIRYECPEANDRISA